MIHCVEMYYKSDFKQQQTLQAADPSNKSLFLHLAQTQDIISTRTQNGDDSSQHGHEFAKRFAKIKRSLSDRTKFENCAHYVNARLLPHGLWPPRSSNNNFSCAKSEKEKVVRFMVQKNFSRQALGTILYGTLFGLLFATFYFWTHIQEI